MTVAKHGDTVKVHYTGTLDDGTVFDSSAGRDPLEFTIGSQAVIRGFEEAVVGLGVGDRRTVAIEPEDAYGPRRDENVIVVNRSQFPADLHPKPGMTVQGQAAEGTVTFVVQDVSGDNVTLDANHELAGQRLTFEVEMVQIAAS